MMRRLRISSSTIVNLIIVAVIVAIFVFGGGSLRPVIERFGNTLNFTKICRGTPGENEIELQIIDVDQGDCALIRSNVGNILIDSGTNLSENDLREHLDLCEIKQIDYFFCSHAHDDHMGGADMVVTRYDVKNLIIPKSSDSTYTLERMLGRAADKGLYPTYASVGDVYTLGDITVTVLLDGSGENISNEASLVLLIRFGQMDFLFTGDIGEDTEMLLLDTYGPEILDCEFLKIAHHGANTSSCTEFLGAVSPVVASVSCELYNEYGHPRGEMLRRLTLCGCNALYRTDTMSTCILRTDGDALYFMASKELVSK